MVRARGRTPAPPAGDGGADLEVGRAAVGIGVLSLAVPPGPGRGTADPRGPGCMLGLLGPARTGTRRGRVHGVRRHRRAGLIDAAGTRSEEHTSALQSLTRISSAVFCL